jgi:hypothetical protein
VSTGAVELRSALVELDGAASVAVREVREAAGACVDSGGEVLSPSPDESTTAAITPPAAAAATAAASAAFFTGSEATLGRRCLHASKNS